MKRSITVRVISPVNPPLFLSLPFSLTSFSKFPCSLSLFLICSLFISLITRAHERREEKAWVKLESSTMIRYVKNICFLFIIIFSITSLAFSQISETQKDIITTISNTLKLSKYWSNTTNPCSWKGVNCTGNSITAISLTKFGISRSEFLSDLCKLDSLESVDVSNNQLGSLPDGFFSGCGKLSGLKLVNFSMNVLSGALPTFDGFLALESLDLSYNSLNGAVTSQLDGLVSARSLNLRNNRLSGPVPTKLGKNLVLEELKLSQNKFSGPMPEELSKYRNLTLIDLSFNNLSGSVPAYVSELSKLESLVLSVNRLGGEVPQFLSSMRNLRRFSANVNFFVGAIPQGITQYLQRLDLSYNNLRGPVPSDLLSPPSLQYVDLTYNSLEGAIPADISTSLYRLRLSGNKLNGSIPSSIGKLTNLMYLELDGNELSGTVPLEIEKCGNLILLNLARNRLEGPIPRGLGRIPRLGVLNLQQNRFSSMIPAEISQLRKLITLNLSGNSLTGVIPDGIVDLRSLLTLNLNENMLNGSIPATIDRLDSLIELQLGGNKLSGVIPRMPPNLQIALNLSGNHFEGRIPATLGNLLSLMVLDLSSNQFAGEVPSFLTQLVSLTELVLSNNQLSGTLPQFSSRVVISIEGNNDLSRPSPPPTLTPEVHQKKRNVATLVVVVAAAVFFLTVGIAAVAFIVSRRLHRVDDDNHRLEENLPQVTSGHLITTQSVHRSNINFARAMESVSNPVNTTIKSKFSTYYKALMPSGMTYCVKKLNRSEKIFQFGSHERFGQELENLGRLNNSRVMIPLAYVLTADNAYLFYEHAHMGTLFDFLHKNSGESLDWTCRYCIALGVAQGLSFLHRCAEPVLLLDLSTKTILLKSLSEPQIADIELYKVIDPSKSTGSLSTVAGSVGYIPPEYAYTMRVTMAGNVYSFGVILLELLTGKPSVSEGTELAKWVLSKSMQNDGCEEILDSTISKTSVAVRRQMLSLLKIALACVNMLPDARPKTKNVVTMLLNAR